MILKYLAFALVGRLTVWLWQKTPFSDWLSRKSEFLSRLFECDLCFGFWVYTVLSIPFMINIFDGWFYMKIISEILTGMVTTFLVYLVKIGWDTTFRIFEVK